MLVSKIVNFFLHFDHIFSHIFEHMYNIIYIYIYILQCFLVSENKYVLCASVWEQLYNTGNGECCVITW